MTVEGFSTRAFSSGTLRTSSRFRWHMTGDVSSAQRMSPRRNAWQTSLTALRELKVVFAFTTYDFVVLRRASSELEACLKEVDIRLRPETCIVEVQHVGNWEEVKKGNEEGRRDQLGPGC